MSNVRYHADCINANDVKIRVKMWREAAGQQRVEINLKTRND